MAAVVLFPQANAGLNTNPNNWTPSSPKPLLTSGPAATTYTNTYGGGATSGRWDALHNNTATVSASNQISLPTSGPTASGNTTDTGTVGWWLDPTLDTTNLAQWPFKVPAGIIDVSLILGASSSMIWTPGQIAARLFVFDDATATWTLVTTPSSGASFSCTAGGTTTASLSATLASDLVVTNRQYLYLDFWLEITATLAPGGSSKMVVGSNTWVRFNNGIVPLTSPRQFLRTNQSVNRAALI